MHDGEMLLVPQRFESGHRRMQSEEAVKIDHALPRDGDAGAHVVIRLLAMRHNDVQAVGGAALEEYDQALLPLEQRVSAAYTARVRKLGTTLVPTMASAPFFRKTLRVMDMVVSSQRL